MPGFNCLYGSPHDLIHRLHHTVRRQAAVLTAEVHAAPGSEHSNAQRIRGGELCLQKIPASCREDIVVVKAGGASIFQQLPHTGKGGKANYLPVQVFPYLIQGGEPVKKLHILHLRQVSGEDLIEVMVGVHQTGIAPEMVAVNNGIGGLRQMGTNGLNQIVLAEKIHILENTVLAVTAHQCTDIFYQQSRHR